MTFLVTWVVLAVMAVLWALATPVFASPDENAHAAKAIGTVRGELVGHRDPDSRFPAFSLPDAYRYDPQVVCFAYHPKQPADCGAELGGRTGTDRFDSWVSSYNPVYYAIAGWPSLVVGGSAGIYAMRIMSALLVTALLAATIATALAVPRARWLPAGLAFSGMPMLMFLGGSINPQATEAAAAVLLLVALLRLIEVQETKPEERRMPLWLLWALVVVGALLLTVARATGPLWVVVVVTGTMTVAGWRHSARLFLRPRNYIPIGILAAGGAFSLVWTVVTGTLSGQAERGDAPLVGASLLSGAWTMIRNTPRYLREVAGVFGWQDTGLPDVVYAVFFGALAILFAIGVVAIRGRWRLVIVGALAVALLVPVVTQSISVSRTGIIWQGRYGMFLYLGVILVLTHVMSRRAPHASFLSPGISTIVIGMLSVYGVLAFVLALRRYVIGTAVPITHMISAPQWQPPLGWPVLVGLTIVAVGAFAVWMIALARVSAERDV